MWRKKARSADDFTDEVRSHIALETDRLIAQGQSPEEAERIARARFGSVAGARERFYEAGRFLPLHDLVRDIRYAVRALLRTPTFTTVAILTLALGIGATTTVLSVVDAILLEPLPYSDSGRLVRIAENLPARGPSGIPRRRQGMTWSEFAVWRTRTTTLSSMAYYLVPPITLMPTPSGSARLTVALVSPEIFAMLGGRALIGRTLDSHDAVAGSNVVVVSVNAWKHYFQSDPGVIGRTISLKTQGPESGFLDGTPLTVVGVMPSIFDFPSAQVEFWTPIVRGSPAESRLAGGVIARLDPQASLPAATDEANAIGESLRLQSAPGMQLAALPPGVRRFEVQSVKEQIVAPVRPALRLLLVAVLVVLFIVCANVASLLLTRGSARLPEIATRLALGASRARVVRQLLAEGLVLAAFGGLLGAALAVGGVYLVRALATLDAQGVFQIAFAGNAMLPRLNEVVIDGRVLGFAMLLAAVAAFVSSIVPAVRLSGVDYRQAMGHRGSDGQGSALRSDTRLRSMLVVGHLTLATVLLVASALLINSFTKLTRVDPGWNPAGVLTFYLVMPQDYSTTRKAALIENLLAELTHGPSVENAGYTYAGPLLGLVDTLGPFVPPGRTPEEMKGSPDTPQVRAVSHDFLQTMGVRLLAGRWLTPHDNASAAPVLLVNRSVVRRLFGNENPVGKFVHFDGRMEFRPQEIVGVVEDMRQASLDVEPVPQMFIDYRQMLAIAQERQMPTAVQERLAFGFLSFVIRTKQDPATLIPAVQSLVGRVDPAAGIDVIVPMERLAATSLTRPRFFAILLGVFAVLAATLAVIGLYGVMAYGVAQRTREIGIRMALGARRLGLLGLVLRQGLVLTVVGILLGVAGAAAVSRYLKGMLYGLTPLDPETFVAVSALFLVVATVAVYLPARRASKMDPLVALRYE